MRAELATLHGEELIGASGKLLVLDGLLSELFAMGSRVLLFSTFTQTLDVLGAYTLTLRAHDGDWSADPLAAVAAAYGPTAYAVVSTPDAAPRITHVRPRFEEGPRVRIGVGRRSVDRLRECGAIGLLWPAGADQSMSLIVDGELEWADDDGEILVRLISAVRHRPAP